jgi:hypothetical protein
VSKTYQIIGHEVHEPQRIRPWDFQHAGYYWVLFVDPDGLYRTEMYYIFRAIDLLGIYVFYDNLRAAVELCDVLEIYGPLPLTNPPWIADASRGPVPIPWQTTPENTRLMEDK